MESTTVNTLPEKSRRGLYARGPRAPYTGTSRTTHWRNRRNAGDIRDFFPSINPAPESNLSNRLAIVVDSDSSDSEIEILNSSEPLVPCLERLEAELEPGKSDKTKAESNSKRPVSNSIVGVSHYNPLAQRFIIYLVSHCAMWSLSLEYRSDRSNYGAG
jgi:hypothetical protein